MACPRASFISSEKDAPVNAAEYRAKAREMRDKARTTHDQRTRAQLVAMADQYDLLAATAPDHQRESEKP
jgi:hypothetical protein